MSQKVQSSNISYLFSSLSLFDLSQVQIGGYYEIMQT